MSYAVTEYCIGCRDRSCIGSCPSKCFYLEPLARRIRGLGVLFCGSDSPSYDCGMLMIHPDECTSCGACETECPVEAIYEDCSIPDELQDWILLNTLYTRSLSGERKERLRQVSGDHEP